MSVLGDPSTLLVGVARRQRARSDLENSIAIFAKFQAERLVALDRENGLLADLPSLKALMTTNDERTIEDGAVEFWKVSGADLFALADHDGNFVAAFNGSSPAGEPMRKDLRSYMSGAPNPFLVSGSRLFECSVRPIYFGSQSAGTILGYVITRVLPSDRLGRRTT